MTEHRINLYLPSDFGLVPRDPIQYLSKGLVFVVVRKGRCDSHHAVPKNRNRIAFNEIQQMQFVSSFHQPASFRLEMHTDMCNMDISREDGILLKRFIQIRSITVNMYNFFKLY